MALLAAGGRQFYLARRPLPVCPSARPAGTFGPIRNSLTADEIAVTRIVIATDPLMVTISRGQPVRITAIDASYDYLSGGTDAAVTVQWTSPTSVPARLFFGPPLTGSQKGGSAGGTIGNLTRVWAVVSPTTRRIVGIFPGPGSVARDVPKSTCRVLN